MVPESSYFSQTDGRPKWPSFESAQNKTRGTWEWGFQERKLEGWRTE